MSCCTACGTDLSPGARICLGCGAAPGAAATSALLALASVVGAVLRPPLRALQVGPARARLLAISTGSLLLLAVAATVGHPVVDDNVSGPRVAVVGDYDAPLRVHNAPAALQLVDASTSKDLGTSLLTPGAATATRASTAQDTARATAARTPTRAGAAAAHVRVVAAYIPFSARRKAETATYARRHYGVATWHLRPSMIVLHFTESTTMSSARNAFAHDGPNTGELPGTCAHFIVDRDGRVYAIVPVTVLCRHTIGLNNKAIGIEMVQSTSGHSAHWADQQILARHAQIASVLRLVRQLQMRWGIPTSRVIGHAMANGDPAFRDLRGWHNDHSDWQKVDVMEVRRRLARM